MFDGLTKFFHDQSGETAIEYALIAGIISIVIVTSVTTMGTVVSTTFTKIGSAFTR